MVMHVTSESTVSAERVGAPNATAPSSGWNVFYGRYPRVDWGTISGWYHRSGGQTHQNHVTLSQWTNLGLAEWKFGETGLVSRAIPIGHDVIRQPATFGGANTIIWTEVPSLLPINTRYDATYTTEMIQHHTRTAEVAGGIYEVWYGWDSTSGARGMGLAGLVKSGDVMTIHYHSIAVGTAWFSGLSASVYINGAAIPITTQALTDTVSSHISIARSGITVVPPIVTRSVSVRWLVGSPVDWYWGVEGTWGFTTTNSIPDKGEVRNVTLDAFGNDVRLSTAGVIFDRVGVVNHQFELRDEHSLSTLPEYSIDDTFASTTRRVVVETSLSPLIQVDYSPLADSSVAGLNYDSTMATLPCGGERGWTNQPLDVHLDPDTIVGTFDTMLRLPDFNSITTNAVATRSNYTTESPNTLGTPVSGVLTQVGAPTNELSATAHGLVKIDRTAPIPGVTFHGGTNFEDNSQDALSGISTSRPSKIAFSTVGGAQPADGAFTTFDNITIPQGTYDVWLQATDKAGNVATAMVQGGVYISGEITLTKDTTLGATLHTSVCDNHDLITTESDCAPSCTIGANVDITGTSEMTYQIGRASCRERV